MPKLMLISGKPAAKADLMTDDDVIQMLAEAEAKGKAGLPDKTAVIQSLTVEEIPETIKQALAKDVPTKEMILQSLTIEDVPEAIKQKIVEDAKVVSPVMQKFVDGIMGAVKIGTGVTTGDETLLSQSQRIYRKLGSR